MPFQLKPTFRDELAQSDRPLVGMWVCSGSPLVAEICAGAGLDWILIDTEHSANGLESTLTQLQVIAAYPTTAMVRVPSDDLVVIKQVLDLGAQNLLVPMINTAEQARGAVQAMRYPPTGRRGVGSALARSGRWNRVEGYLGDADRQVALCVQIETIEAIEAIGNAAEIASVDGVDAVFVGPSDLAASMGLLGQQSHPDVIDAVRRVFVAAREVGTPAGVNAFDPDVAQGYLESGADFVLVGADVTLLAKGSEALAGRWIPR